MVQEEKKDVIGQNQDFVKIQRDVEKTFFVEILNKYEDVYVLATEEETNEKTVLARDKRNGRLVTVKFMPRAQGKVYDKFLGRNHMNVVPVLDMAYRDEMCVVVLEYISGLTLDQVMNGQGIFSEEEAVSILCQLLDGLEFIHSFGIVHRDIHPGNILISSDGVVKITDLGIARNKKENQRTDTTVLGTVGYAAPEQFGFAQTDARTDIYSVGVLLNVMLTGKLPTIYTYDGGLAEVVKKAIQISPDARIQTIGEFRTMLGQRRSGGEGLSRIGVLGKKELDSFSEKDLIEVDHKKIPGFRTGKTWKKWIAVFLYAWMGMFTVVLVVDGFEKGSFIVGIFEILIMLITFWIPFAIASNWGNWKERVWPFSKMNRDLITVLRVVVPFIVFYIGISLDTWNRPK